MPGPSTARVSVKLCQINICGDFQKNPTALLIIYHHHANI